MNDLLALTIRAQSAHFWYHGFRSVLEPAIAAVANGRRTLTMVDCGCGTGHNLALLRPYGRAFGFDLDAASLAHARTGSRLLAHGDVTRVPIASDSVDITTSFDVLQQIEDDHEAVREMARVLKSGGHVVLTLAALNVPVGDHNHTWGQVRRYTPATARALAEQAGLSVERISFMFASVFPLMYGVRLAQRLLRPIRGHRLDADIAVPTAPINVALTWLVRAEAIIARRIPMPFGSTLLLIARKTGD